MDNASRRNKIAEVFARIKSLHILYPGANEWTTTGYFDIERRMLPDDWWQGSEILTAAPQVKRIALLTHHKNIHEGIFEELGTVVRSKIPCVGL